MRGGPPADRGPRFDRGGRAGGGGGDRGDRKSRWGGGAGDDEGRNDGGGGGPEGGPPGGGGPNPGVGLLGAAPPGFNPIVPLASAGQPAPGAPPAGAPRQDEAEDAVPADTAEPQKLSEELERSMQQADAPPSEAAAVPPEAQSEPQHPAPSAGGFSLYDEETPLNPETQPAATTEAESHPTHFEEEPQQQQVPDQQPQEQHAVTQPQEQHAVTQPFEEHGGHEGNGVPNEGPGGHEGHDDLGGHEKAPEVAPVSSEPPADTQEGGLAADGGGGEGDAQPE